MFHLLRQISLYCSQNQAYRYLISVTAISPMFYAYDIKSGETSNSPDRDAELQARKVPRLALSTDVKTLRQSSQHYNNLPLVSSSVQMPFPSYSREFHMEVDNMSPYQQGYGMNEHGDQCWQSAHIMDSSYNRDRLGLESAYPALLPAPYHDPNATASTTELSSGRQPRHLLPPYARHAQDAQFDKVSCPRVQPAFYPSPPQSTASSPLEPVNSQATPIQPSPSLPLHQPRPSRRIPIISLSRLASACDDIEAASRRKPTVSPKARTTSLSNNFPDLRQPQSQYLSRTRERRMLLASPLARDDDRAGCIVQCSCGCMESYAIG